MMVGMADAETLLTSSEAGQILGKSARTVSRLAQTGVLPHAARLAAGQGIYLFKRADVDEFKRQADEKASA